MFFFYLSLPTAPSCAGVHPESRRQANRVENLEWVTPSENIHHAFETGLRKSGCEHFRAKLTAEQVREIRRDCVPGDPERGFKPFARITACPIRTSNKPARLDGCVDLSAVANLERQCRNDFTRTENFPVDKLGGIFVATTLRAKFSGDVSFKETTNLRGLDKIFREVILYVDQRFCG